MAMNSSTVAANQIITAAERNALRLDTLSNSGFYATSGGAADVQTLSIDAQYVAYVAGDVIKFKAGFTNTGACTINVNAIGAVNIKSTDGTDPIFGDILAGAIIELGYDGTNFQILTTGKRAEVIDRSWTASETIAANEAVSMIEGTADSVELTRKHSMDDPVSLGNAASSSDYSGSKVTDLKFALFYRDSVGGYARVKIATVDPETLDDTYGTSYLVSGASVGTGYLTQVLYMEDDKIAFLYFINATDIRMRIGTVSGTVVTLGTEVVLDTPGGSSRGCAMCMIGTDKIAVTFLEDSGGANDYVHIFNVTVSGTTITSYFANVITRTDANYGDRKVDIASYTDDEVQIVYDSGAILRTWKVSFSGNTPSSGATATLGGMIANYVNISWEGNYYLVVFRGDGNDIMAELLTTAGASTGTTKNITDTEPDASIGTLSTDIVMDVVGLHRAVILARSSGTGYVQWMEISVVGTAIYCVAADGSYYAGATPDMAVSSVDYDRTLFVVHYGASATGWMHQEYDNTGYCVGFALNSASATEDVAARSRGKLTGFAGFTVGDRQYMENHAYDLTDTVSGKCFGVATDTDELDINLDLETAAALGTTERNGAIGTGYQRIYHNLGVLPKTVTLNAQRYGSGYTGWSVGKKVGSISYCTYWYSSDANRAGADNSEVSGFSTSLDFLSTAGAAGGCSGTIVDVTSMYVDLNFSTYAGSEQWHGLLEVTD